MQIDLLIALRKSIAIALGGNDDWDLVTDEHDPDGQTILFHYPAIENLYGDYIKPSVKIELGARSDHWPTQHHVLQPYLHENLPINTIAPYNVKVKVLDVARTFWEKATILHMYAYWPEHKTVAPRQSRHYYDFFKLLKSAHLSDILTKIELLIRVAKHKQIYFRAGWAKYDQAKIGTLKLTAPSHVEVSMSKDYQAMQEMFFKTPPAWDEITNTINQFEQEFNTNT